MVATLSNNSLYRNTQIIMQNYYPKLLCKKEQYRKTYTHIIQLSLRIANVGS